jgi:HSP20 family protein
MRHLVKTNFDPLFKNFFDMDNSLTSNKGQLPAVNIAENETEYHLEFSLAGYKKEDLNINLEHDTLTVSAEMKQEKSTDAEGNEVTVEDKNYTRREYFAQSFSRSFYLPELVEEKNIEAKFKDGVLTLTLPKSEKVKPKQISIK